MVEELTRLGPVYVRKVIPVGREEVSEPGRGRSGLRCASWDVPTRTMRLEIISFGGSRGVLHEAAKPADSIRIRPMPAPIPERRCLGSSNSTVPTVDRRRGGGDPWGFRFDPRFR
ncbi:hypothetical protein BHE74_00029017 [Ensete ventricosum]|nr:hypothetical protein GW17_00021235 [Ensete ventricosum]RWW63787.1 hypothetical protein BHE74_00029017 [Ensete ventricosum]